MSDRHNIKVNAETFEQLKGDKPEGVSWSYYLDELHQKAIARDGRESDIL